MDPLLALLLAGAASVADWGPTIMAAVIWGASGLALAEALAYALNQSRRPDLLRELRRALPSAAGLVIAQIAAIAIALAMEPDNDILGDVALLYLLFALLLPILWAVGQKHASAAAMPRRVTAWSRRRTFITLGAIVAAGLALNLFTVLITDVRPGADVLAMTEGTKPAALAFLAVWLILNAPWHEEILFRHYLVPRLARFGNSPAAHRTLTALAIIIPAIIFALGHAGNMDPAWPKLIQAFTWGLILGWARVWLGTGYAIGLHLFWNITAPLFAPFVHAG